MIVDDNPRERLFLSAALQAWGAMVTATAADEGTHTTLLADVIVCDLETIEEAGSGFLERLFRAHSVGGLGVPSIALVPLRGALSGLAARFHRHLNQPVTGDEIRQAVRALIAERR